MNSNQPDSTPITQTTVHGLSITPPTDSQKQSSSTFADAPLDDLLEKKVHEMTDEECFLFVKHMATLRSSAQTRKAEVRKESGPKKAKKDSSVELAQKLLADLLG